MKSFLLKFLLPFLAFAAVMSGVSIQASAYTGVDPAVLFVAGTAGVVMYKAFSNPAPLRFTHMGIDVAIWANYIIEKFRKNNAFLSAVYSDDQYVKEGKYVIIPQAGDDPKVTKNRETFPAEVKRREDNTLVYKLDAYRTDPTHILKADQYEVSYDKMDSILGGHVNTISQKAADDVVVKWLSEIPQSNIILTTGANTSEILTGATGTRKVFVYNNLKIAQRKMNADDVPQEGRICLISSAHLDELTSSFNDNQYALFSQGYDAASGRIGRLFGFDFYERSTVARMSLSGGSDLVVKPWGSAEESGDRDVTICLQHDAVTKAMGSVEIFEDLGAATMYGDIYSTEVHMGGRRRRADNKGIYVIAQALGA